jgi:hypothetical protein
LIFERGEFARLLVVKLDDLLLTLIIVDKLFGGVLLDAFLSLETHKNLL